MLSQEQILNSLVNKITEKVGSSIKEAISEPIAQELTAAVSRLMLESDFYKQLNKEMRNGLKGIYKEIEEASGKSPDSEKSKNTQMLFNETTAQLDAIAKTMLEATESIMGISEALLQQQEESMEILESLNVSEEDKHKIEKLKDFNGNLSTALTDIISSLSFQDLTGQRLKKVVQSINTIRETVFDLYISTGIMIKQMESEPEVNIAEIKAESKKVAAEIRGSQLKGPSSESISQSGVDSLLANLGL